LEPLRGRFCQGVEVVFQRDDRELHLLLNAKPFFSQEKILGCVVTLTDVTKGKLTEKTLKEAAGAAEDANRAKSEFLANMSHEIRTPMTVFLAALDHLLQIERNPEHRHLLEMADTSARRLRALIDEILDFSRIEARRVELAEEPFELRTCVREAVEMFALPAALGIESKLSCQLSRRRKTVNGFGEGEPTQIRSRQISVAGQTCQTIVGNRDITLSLLRDCATSICCSDHNSRRKPGDCQTRPNAEIAIDDGEAGVGRCRTGQDRKVLGRT
jgi:signal transduction histidine kinase